MAVHRQKFPFVGFVLCLTFALVTGSEFYAAAPAGSGGMAVGAQGQGRGGGRLQPRPISGWFEGGPSGDHDTSVVCPQFYTRNSEVRGGGILSHLGMTEVRATVCSRMVGIAPPTVFLELAGGQAVFTAANGDELVTDAVGTYAVNLNCSAMSTLDLTLTVLSGTGRFANAVGSLKAVGTQVPGACPAGSDPPRFHITMGFEGTIANIGG